MLQHRVGTLDAELGFSPFDFDVIYAYPWPAETAIMFELFSRFARPGGVLVTFHGGADLRVQRAVAGTGVQCRGYHS